jgi:cytochrome c oxidase subunit 2
MSTPSRSPTGRGPLIAATLVVIAIVVAIVVLWGGGATLGGVWQSFFPPPAATVQGREVRGLYDFVFFIAVAIFLVVEGVIVFTAFRYRRKPGDDDLPPQTHGNNLVEVIWTVIPTVIVAVLFFFSWQTLDKVDAVTGQNDVHIRANAARFQWSFDYLDPTDPNKVLFSQFLPQGEGGGMVIPVGVPVKVTLHSPDVIHAFYVPRFLFKRDVVPGKANEFEFTADEAGVYRGQCAELCGPFHGSMQFEVRALPQAEFQTWLQQQIQQANQPSPSAPPPAPSGSGAPPPSGSAAPPPSGSAPPAAGAVNVTAQGIKFLEATLTAPAGAPFTIHFDNKDPSTPHNVEILDQSNASKFKGQIVTGPASADYQVPALQAGTYKFQCTVHPTMTGTLTVQ